MIFNESLKSRIESSSNLMTTYKDIFLGRSWKAAAYSGWSHGTIKIFSGQIPPMPNTEPKGDLLATIDNSLLGISYPFNFFKLKDGSFQAKSINISVHRTGTISYMLLVEDQKSVSELIKSYTSLIKEMSIAGKAEDEILKAISEDESKGYEITMEVGTSGKEIDISNVNLVEGPMLTIDILNIQIGG